MKRWLTIFVWMLAVQIFAQEGAGNSQVHFHAVSVYVDSNKTPLAAYQLEFSVTNVLTKIVGVEGGQHSAFRDAPFYDPKAIQQERVIIGAFGTEKPEQLPIGKTCVAVIHLETIGNERPIFNLKIEAAADSAGNKIPVTVTCGEKNIP